MTETKNNPMREVKIEKITLNVGAGKDTSKLEKGIKLLKTLTGVSPVKTFTNKRIPTWGLRPGLPIGCKITLRKQLAKDMLIRLLDAKSQVLNEKQFDEMGNVSFGIHEYIDIKDAKYDPEIGMMGLQVCITLQRPGFRTKRRKMSTRKIPHRHRISKEESIEFMQKKFNIKLSED